ncbi:MAG: hypothetical protein C4335_10235 [Armatimonadota bacterium]
MDGFPRTGVLGRDESVYSRDVAPLLLGELLSALTQVIHQDAQVHHTRPAHVVTQNGRGALVETNLQRIATPLAHLVRQPLEPAGQFGYRLSELGNLLHQFLVAFPQLLEALFQAIQSRDGLAVALP